MSKEAKPDTWMPLVIGDYLKDTTRLTTEQHGAYLLLIMTYWVEGPPPDSDEDLAAITKLDLKTWKKHRAKIQAFFRIEDGRWRQKRADEELERWARKKEQYAERAAAGGRAKAAKSSSQAGLKQEKTGQNGCLKAAPQPASVEVEGPNGPSTLYGQAEFLGPSEVLADFTQALGDEWVASYLLPCAWQDVPERALIPATRMAGAKLIRDGRAILAKHGLTVLERAAA